ncbi:N-acetylglucosamine kinase [[Phormidium] sp. ETS-05]|uniref:N-acetylglucosamine kinase n=1 Tax=[Phormidium] sp. ETS-05 TaxID=222819 RepID=UPI0018EF0C3D|nr:BadF/BadG/BcrA/BcrD ATPase family protein [[Phormidium] sp. ETS-05]
MGCVLGIDGGGTKTVCVLMEESGEVVGRGDAGPSNYQTVGLDAAGEEIALAISGALRSAVDSGWQGDREVRGIGVGLAGVGRPEDVVVVYSLVQHLQYRLPLPLTWAVSPAAIVVENDCTIALVGGIGDNVGVVTIAGTGAIAYGRNREGITKRASGWGYLLGDEGSGYDIAVQGLRAAVRAHDGRGPHTILGERFQERLQIANLEEVIELVYRRGWSVKDIAALATVVDIAAADGDHIATAIIDNAISELVLATRVVCEGLFAPGEPFDLVTSGGMWKGMSQFRDKFADAMTSVIGSVNIIWPSHEPAYGAAMLALHKLKD